MVCHFHISLVCRPDQGSVPIHIHRIHLDFHFLNGSFFTFTFPTSMPGCCSRISTMSGWLRSAAQMRALYPFLSGLFTSVFGCCNNSCTTLNGGKRSVQKYLEIIREDIPKLRYVPKMLRRLMMLNLYTAERRDVLGCTINIPSSKKLPNPKTSKSLNFPLRDSVAYNKDRTFIIIRFATSMYPLDPPPLKLDSVNDSELFQL